MICSFLWVLITIAPISSSFSQKRYLFRTYTTDDGLPNNNIFSINQDNKGYLWIATDGGISRFDGYRFDNSVIPEVNKEQAFSQYVDKSPSGKLAFATFMNGVMVETDNGSFRQYLRHEKQLGKNVVRTLKWLSDDQILFSESRNVNIIAGDSIYQVYDWGRNGNFFQTVEYDSLGNIWFGGLRGLGIIFPADTVKQPVFLPEFEDVFVLKVLLMSDNKLLVGTDNGYYEIDIQSAKKEDFRYSVSQPYPELIGERVNHIYCDKQDNIWVSFVNNGVFQIHNNQILRHITQASGLPTMGAMCVFQDKEFNYWIGTSEGICRMYSLRDFSYTHDNKQLAGIHFFEQDKHKRLWLSSGSTLYLIDKDMVGASHINNTPFAGSELIALAFINNFALFITNTGLFSMPCDGEIKWHHFKKEIDFKKNKLRDLKCFYFDDDESQLLWLGFSDGLYAYSDNRITKATIISDKPVNLRPNGILKDKYGYYWVGDYTFGLHRFKLEDNSNNEARLHLKNSYESLKPDSAFATSWVQDLMLDNKGNIWLSSLYTGAYRLEIDENGVSNYSLYSTENGLSSNDITQIVQGKDHSMWFGTRNGVDRLISDDMGKEKIIHYNEKNGLGRFVYRILPDDSITYISYEEGFFAVDNRLDHMLATQKLDVIITNITVMGNSDFASLQNLNEIHLLPHNHNFISFEFTSIHLKDNEGIAYQYKLEGIDKDWSEYTDRHYASYNSLPHGTYSFNVRAKMINYDTVGPVTTYRFKINRPWYQTWWFFLSIVAFSAANLFFIYFNHIRNLLRLQRLRTKIASDLHDDIGSTLSSISIMSDLLQSQLDCRSRAEEMLQTIGSNAHEMLESMDDIIWSVNPSNDIFQNLALRIREYAIPLFESKDVKFQIVTPDELAEMHLSMDVRRNVFLIVKEAVNNIVKYSDCSMASIEFGYNQPILNLVVKDNGKGFDIKKTNSNRNGLKNMILRAEQMNGTLAIFSEIGMGTNILLSVKSYKHMIDFQKRMR